LGYQKYCVHSVSSIICLTLTLKRNYHSNQAKVV